MTCGASSPSSIPATENFSACAVAVSLPRFSTAGIPTCRWAGIRVWCRQRRKVGWGSGSSLGSNFTSLLDIASRDDLGNPLLLRMGMSGRGAPVLATGRTPGRINRGYGGIPRRRGGVLGSQPATRTFGLIIAVAVPPPSLSPSLPLCVCELRGG